MLVRLRRPFDRAALISGGAVFVCALAVPVAYAGLFDDDEARKQIAVERKRVDDVKKDLEAQQQTVDARINKIEEALKSQALLDLFTQIEALKAELRRLMGVNQVHVNIEEIRKPETEIGRAHV